MLEKLERKFGKYAIPHLINYLIGGYIIGYLLELGAMVSNLNMLSLMRLEPYRIIHRFQIWRIITWVLVPPDNGNIIFAIIMIIFYWQLGTALERTWGTFKFNAYIFGGIICTVIGAFVMYLLVFLTSGVETAGIGSYFSTNYINLTIFLAFALTYPEERVLLYFIIPIKMKWLAIVYVVILVPEFILTAWPGRVAMIASLANFIIFFFSSRDFRRFSPGEMKRRRDFRNQYNAGRSQYYGGGGNGQRVNPFAGHPNASGARHKCAICGRTELTNPELEFRFCTKCKGNYEYCNDHLFTHTHVT